VARACKSLSCASFRQLGVSGKHVSFVFSNKKSSNRELKIEASVGYFCVTVGWFTNEAQKSTIFQIRVSKRLRMERPNF
jgi:hypothetical protein